MDVPRFGRTGAPPSADDRARRRGPAERGQSNVIGVVLIIGMVITSATLIAFTGASVMDQYREMVGQESTTNAVEEIDTELSSVASVGGMTRTEFSIGDARPSQYRIVRSGHVNVTANRNASCRAHIPLSSLRYERDDGVIIGYEAGGIWRQQGGLVSQTAMHTPPDFTFENGTLAMTVINVSGEIEGSRNLVYENVSESIDANEAVQDALFNGECARPDNVTISITSDFYRGWKRYLETSINGTSHTTYDSNQTTRVFLAQDKLPEVTDDTRNDVVDLTNSSDFVNVTNTSNSITVDKGTNNTYTAIVTPLSSGSTQVGEIRVVEDDAAYRPPLDVVFVIDKSGSMGGSKMANAKDAAQAFVGAMNDSYDRAGVVVFNGDGTIKVTEDDEYITNDFGGPYGTTGGVNESIEDVNDGGGTDIGSGIHEANVMMGLTSDASREKVIILLGDGDNQDSSEPSCDKECLDQRAFDEAKVANDDGITIHTIGVGSPDEAVMTDIAQNTGGTYRYVDDANNLSAVFLDLFAEISSSKQIVRNPLSMQMHTGSTTFYPQIDGESGHVARNGSGGELNLNDPTAPSNFSFSIDISDGENVSMTAHGYECARWERTGQVHTNQSTGQQYNEVRCAEIDNSTAPTNVSPSNTSVYVNGSNVSSLLDQPGNWWEEDLRNETLAPYLDGPNDATLDLKSNEAIVVFEFDQNGGTNRLIVKYRVGQATTDAVPRQIFNIDVRHVVVGRGR